MGRKPVGRPRLRPEERKEKKPLLREQKAEMIRKLIEERNALQGLLNERLERTRELKKENKELMLKLEESNKQLEQYHKKFDLIQDSVKNLEEIFERMLKKHDKANTGKD